MAILSFLAIAVACVASASAQSNSTTLALGQQCDPAANKCAPGVSCYAVNSMLIPSCGKFQGTCTSTSQCATNECDSSGLCGGPLLLSLGAQCNSSAQCANGADCYAVNSMLITRCGNFQSSCSYDGQCAFNHCVGGFCAGSPLSSSTTSVASTAAASSSVTTSGSATVTANSTTAAGSSLPTTTVNPSYVNGTATATGTPSASASPPYVQAGGAEKKAVRGMGALIMVGVVMFIL